MIYFYKDCKFSGGRGKCIFDKVSKSAKFVLGVGGG